MNGFSFRLVEFNCIREARGADAARVQFILNGEVESELWMSKSDINNNLLEWADCDTTGLLAAIFAYNHDWIAAGLEPVDGEDRRHFIMKPASQQVAQ